MEGNKSPGTSVHYLKQLLLSLSLLLSNLISKRQDFFYKAPLGETDRAIRVSENTSFQHFRQKEGAEEMEQEAMGKSEKTLKCSPNLCWFKPHMSHCFRCLRTLSYQIQNEGKG